MGKYFVGRVCPYNRSALALLGNGIRVGRRFGRVSLFIPSDWKADACYCFSRIDEIVKELASEQPN